MLTGPEHVITIADFAGALQYGVIEAGRFTLPVGQTFALADIAEAHRVGEAGQVRGKLVLLVD